MHPKKPKTVSYLSVYPNTEAAVSLSVGDEAEQHHYHRPEQPAPSPPPPPCCLQHGQQCAGQRGRSGTVEVTSSRILSFSIPLTYKVCFLLDRQFVALTIAFIMAK